MPRRPGLVLQDRRNEHGLILFSVDPRDLDIILRTVKCLRSSARMPTINCSKILNPITVMFFITYYLEKILLNITFMIGCITILYRILITLIFSNFSQIRTILEVILWSLLSKFLLPIAFLIILIIDVCRSKSKDIICKTIIPRKSTKTVFIGHHLFVQNIYNVMFCLLGQMEVWNDCMSEHHKL